MTDIGHNGGPAMDPAAPIFAEINDLFEEAKNFADGEPIASEEMHDAITKLRDTIHDAGKRAEEVRVELKRPLDEQIKAIQDRFNPFTQAKKGKVDLAKAALGDLLAAWRKKKADEAAAEAARIAAIAAEEEAKARAAMAESRGNLEARVDAEDQADNAKAWAKDAKRADKAATSGLGLRTVWVTSMEDAGAALDWAYGQDSARFDALALEMAREKVRMGARSLPGFVVREEKVAL